ncbi:hypothetical protein CMO93_01625 [Candidatus Woesearchaeota archaeon]|nr:hypothetical protein [Candidatus Woesearchaeota archaeon]|tara:strand:- start:476 stop:1138 length:663 start_codon:yes stop_codon:yes gene_type:complete
MFLNIFSGRLRKAIIGLLIIANFGHISNALAHEARLPQKELVRVEREYTLLRREVDRLITHGKGINAARVKSSLKILGEIISLYNYSERLLKSRGAGPGILKEFNDRVKAMETLKEALQILFSFEVDEDYLRDNINNPKVLSNARQYVIDLYQKVQSASSYERHVVSEYKKGFSLVIESLKSEIEQDILKINKAIKEKGTGVQYRQWRTFLRQNGFPAPF